MAGQSFWAINANPTYSWVWRKLLQLRPLALQFCKTHLGNGKSASFWYDNWSPFGQLIEYLGSAGPRALRLRDNAVVADAVNRLTWTLPHPHSQREVNLHTHLTTINLPLSVEEEDEYVWVAGDSPSHTFRTSTTWEVLKERSDTKNWGDVVWFKGAIPKLSFNMWTANYDRLPTRSRLAGWGLPISPLCPFCSNSDETRDHLLLMCDFSKAIWSEVFVRCHPPSSPFADWSELLSWIRAAPSSNLTLLRKLASQSIIYHMWKQRNNLIHNQASILPAQVFYGIDKELRNIISARRHRKYFHSLMGLWLR